MLSRALATHAELEKSKDMEWIHVILSFLKTLVDGSGSDLLMLQEDLEDYVSGLIVALKQAAGNLDSGKC